MQTISGIFTEAQQPSRDEIKAQMALLPAPDPGDVAFLVGNADLIRDDYAHAFGLVYAETRDGKKTKLVQYGIGAACGLVLGVLVGKLVL